MSDLIDDLYPYALECGISPERFWELSIPDINDIIESEWKIRERNLKSDLKKLHFLAQDIGQYTALMLHGKEKVKVLELWDFFPELFTADHEETDKKIQEQRAAVYKAQMIDFAHRHNNSRKGGKS